MIGNQHVYIDRLIRKLLEDNREVLLSNDTNNAIAYDGIVDEKTYSNQRYKLAFLLKEVNGNTSNGQCPDHYDDWDYVGWIRENQSSGKEKIYPSFRNIAMWTSEFYDVLNVNFAEKDKYLKNGTLLIDDNLCNSLRKIAVINLKKTFGGGVSDWNEINDYLDDKVCNILLEEICAADPSVILCGGREVFDFVLKIHHADKEAINTIVTKGGKKISYINAWNMIYIDFYHPSCRKAREYLFDYAQDIFDTVTKMIQK